MAVPSDDRANAIAPRRRFQQLRPELRLQLVQLSPQRKEGRVNGRARGVWSEKSGCDQLAGGHRFGALGQMDNQSSLLRGESRLFLAQPHRAVRRIEVQPPEAVVACAAGAALDQPRGDV